MNHLRSSRRAAFAGLAVALLAALGACSFISDDDDDDGDSSAFPAGFAGRAQSPNTPFRVSGRWLVYQASEARTGVFGTDFNLDGDRTDDIAIVIDMLGSGELLPVNSTRGGGIAVEDIFVVGDQIYLLADEDQDGVNWNGNASSTDLVLLHWSTVSPVPTVVATLDQTSFEMTLTVGSRLYFTIEDDPAATALVPGDTTLHYVDEAAPTLPVMVPDEDGARILRPRLMAEDEGLLFLLASEIVDGVNLNTDGDMSDDLVLALVDGTNPAAVVRNVGLAIDFETDPVRALSTGVSDWLVAFPVDEVDEGINLNDPALFPATWQPTACIGFSDVDNSDNVLHFLHFGAWVADPVNNPPVDTGLGGRTAILAVPGGGGSPGFVATVSSEDEEGGCVLNGDADPVPMTTPGDMVFRYVEAVQPAGGVTEIQVDPIVDPTLIVAVATGLPESSGVGDLNGRFVIVVDEGADGRSYDGNTGSVNDLVGWLDPSAATPTWEFNHGPLGARSYAGTTWTNPPADRNSVPATEAFIPMTFQESVFGAPINPGDSDTVDRVPALAAFDPTDADGDLDFTIFQSAMTTLEPDVTVLNGWALFPVDEAQDGRDWNLDGARNDMVLIVGEIANPSNTSFSTVLRNNNTFFRDLQMTTDGQFGVAFRIEEAFVGGDFNADGDTTDFIVRWILL